MSLLFEIIDSKVERLAKKIFKKQFEYDKKLDDEYDDYRKSKMYRDIKYNLECLEVAIKYDANKIFEDYALWVVKFLSTHMSDLPKERIREQMITHYRIIGEVLEEENLNRDYQQKAQRHLENAIEVTKEADLKNKNIKKDNNLSSSDNVLEGLYIRFLNSLLQTNKEEAQKVIEEALDNDISLEDIYLNIFQKTMIRVGELWHSGEIKVDEEHYITSMVQNIMMQLWPKIFSVKKIDRKILVCTVGNELHEMGGRILCDLMEIKGWNSVYLGAAVPVVNIISAIKKHEPDLVGLSVTMPIYLEQCERAVKKIKANDSIKINNVKIAVGGRAFSLAPHLPAEWGADVTVNNGIELAEWGKKNI
ncbi:MAG: cobalamin B12-binding domain-containing protein [Bacillota bacterium]